MHEFGKIHIGKDRQPLTGTLRRRVMVEIGETRGPIIHRQRADRGAGLSNTEIRQVTTHGSESGAPAHAGTDESESANQEDLRTAMDPLYIRYMTAHRSDAMRMFV